MRVLQNVGVVILRTNADRSAQIWLAVCLLDLGISGFWSFVVWWWPCDRCARKDPNCAGFAGILAILVWEDLDIWLSFGWRGCPLVAGVLLCWLSLWLRWIP
eukprot:gene24836-biopygen17951